MKVVCPGCNYEHNYSVLDIFKLMKNPTCSQCGANLLNKKGGDGPGADDLEEYLADDADILGEVAPQAQLVECPRCREKQEPARICKWCAAPLKVESKLKKTLGIFRRTDTGPAPGRAPSLSARGMLFKVLAGMVSVYILFVVGAYYVLQGSDVFRTSKEFIEKSGPVRSVVGEEIQAGPFPLIFSYKTSARKSSFYFLVPGDKGYGLVYLRLRKTGNKWGVASGKLWDQSLKSYPLTADATARRPSPKTREKKRITDKEREVLKFLREGQSAYNTRDYNKATLKYTKAIEIDPENPEAYYRRAMAWARLKEKGKAVDDAKKAVHLDPERQTYYYYLSWLYMGNNQHDQAIVLLTELIRRKPDEANAYYYRSRSFQHLKEYQEALNDINRAIEIDPEKYQYYHARGVTYNLMNVPDRAEKDMKRAIELNPKYSAAYFGLSYLYEKQNKFDESIATLTRLIEVTSEEKQSYYLNQAYFRRGTLYRKKGDLKAAAGDFDEACKRGHRGACRELERIRGKG